MKTLKIILAVLFASSIYCPVSHAKESNTMALLMKYKWSTVFDFGHGVVLYEKVNVTLTKWITTLTCEEKDEDQDESPIEFTFYLSDTPDTIFDFDKVGKVKDGKYIIMINKFGEVSRYEIKHLSDKELVIEIILDRPISKNAEAFKTATYKAIPKS